MSHRSRVTWWLAPFSTLGMVLSLLAIAPAAHADDPEGGPMPTACVGAFNCLYFIPEHVHDPEVDPGQPSNVAWDLLPIQSAGEPDEESDDSDGLASAVWQGAFQIRQHGTGGSQGNPAKCMAANDDQQVDPCVELSADQLWYIEPVGAGGTVNTDPDSPGVWNPFDHPFYLRSADNEGDTKHVGWCYGSRTGDLHADQNSGDQTGEFVNCDNPEDAPTGVATDWFQWKLSRTSPYQLPTSNDPGQIQAWNRELSEYALGAALAHGLSNCKAQLDLKSDICSAQLLDTNKEGDNVVSDWNRMDHLKVSKAPHPVLINNSCAAGESGTTEEDGQPSAGTARVLYNGGDADMNATLGASGTNGYSSTLTTGLSTTVEASWDGIFASGKVSVTASVEYGQTWSKSFTTSQEVNWTIPPRQFATATLSTNALELVARWRFNDQGGMFNQWQTDTFTHLNVPFSADGTAKEPDTILAVYNSWSKKACAAEAPSHLDPQRILHVKNLTAPGITPTVGDTLSAEDNLPEWWLESAASQSHVVLRYQWYRQRGAQPAEKINNARLATYTVTEDDLTDPEVIDRLGPYHLFVGITDVADAMRFDSPEYYSLTTSAVTEERARVGDTQLEMSILNEDVEAGTDTIVDIAASAAGAAAPPSGTVTIRDNDVEIGDPVELGPDGTVRTRLRLPRGTHALEAVYAGDGTLGGGVSNVVRTTITGSPSKTSVTLVEETTGVGGVSHATVTVTPTSSADAMPSGQVQLRSNGDTLGDPVTLAPDGTAEVTLPAPMVGGTRQITADYLGDLVFDPSSSEPVTQRVAPIATRVELSSDVLITHRRGRIKWIATVDAPSGQPTGTVLFRVDGRAHGDVITIDDSGRAWLKMKKIPRGKHRISAQYVPTSATHGGSVSPTTVVEVRKHGAKTRIKTNHATIKKGQRLAVTGTVKVTKGGPTVAGRKVQLLVNGVVVAKVKVARNGTYAMHVKRKKLLKGTNEIQVRYVGSRPRSIAPDLSRKLAVRRK